MGVLVWIVIGLFVGVLTLLIEPVIIKRHIVITLMLGVMGAVIGGLISFLLGFKAVHGMQFMIVIWSFGGSVFVLSWYRVLEKYFSS